MINVTCNYKPFWFILTPSTDNNSKPIEGLKMTTITISYDVSDFALSQIVELLEEKVTHDENFNGEKFEIERGDFTSIDSEEASYVKLFQSIQRIINGY